MSEAEFSAYVAARHAALLRTAYLLTGNRHDAEDLLQSSLAKTYLAWDRIRDPAARDGYVRSVMVRSRTSLWRRRRPAELVVAEPPEAGRPDDGYARLDLQAALWSALAGLPPRQRAAVVLRYYEDLTEAEAALVLGVSVGTVKSTTHRALAALRRSTHLQEEPAAARPGAPSGASRSPDNAEPAPGEPASGHAFPLTDLEPSDDRPRRRAPHPAGPAGRRRVRV